MFPAQANAPQLPDLPEGPSIERLRGPVELSAWTTGQIVLVVLLALALLALVAWIWSARLRARHARKARISPETAARAEIEAADLAVEDERFAVLLSGALRNYIEQGLAIPCRAKTTEEFLRQTELPEPLRADLDAFLRGCDQVKFAGRRLGRDERARLSETARRLVERGAATQSAPEREEVLPA